MNHPKSIMRLFGYVLVLVCIVAVGAALAAEGTPEKPAEMAKPAAMEKAKDISITGIVEQGESGLVIKAADADYFVMGQDLTAMLGKTVTATGTLEEGAAGKTLNVMSCKEVAE